MTPEDAKKLREPFPAEIIGKLPKLSCKACSDSQSKECGKHSKSKCQVCGNWISSAHVHLDYVGHAAITDRLLQTDPGWTWDFVAQAPDGAPLLVTDPKAVMIGEQVGLWIKLTVCGVTRPGFGGGKNVKEAIGDALRNAAMRFGVALDLWSKEDLSPSEEVQGEGQQGTDSAVAQAGGAKPQEAATPSATFTIPDKARPNNRPVDGAEKQLASEQVIEQIQALLPALAALRKVDEAAVLTAIEADNGPLHLLDEGPALALLAKMKRWRANLSAAEKAAA